MQSPREQQKPQPVEEKKTFAPKSNTFDFLIPESRKLIRQVIFSLNVYSESNFDR